MTSATAEDARKARAIADRAGVAWTAQRRLPRADPRVREEGVDGGRGGRQRLHRVAAGPEERTHLRGHALGAPHDA